MKKFPRCDCGNIVTEDDCGACTDKDGFTYCCGYNPYTGEHRGDREEDVNPDDTDGEYQ